MKNVLECYPIFTIGDVLKNKEKGMLDLYHETSQTHPDDRSEVLEKLMNHGCTSGSILFQGRGIDVFVLFEPYIEDSYTERIRVALEVTSSKKSRSKVQLFFFLSMQNRINSIKFSSST